MDDAVRVDFFAREERVGFGDELLAYHSSCLSSNGYLPKGVISPENFFLFKDTGLPFTKRSNTLSQMNFA